MKLGSDTVQVDDDTYDVIPPHVNAASQVLPLMYDKLGKPKDPLSTQGEKFMNIMFSVWMDLWPGEASKWLADRTDYQHAEKTITEQVQQKTGRSLATFPNQIYKMIKLFFPEFKFNRANIIKLVQKYPQFRMANRV